MLTTSFLTALGKFLKNIWLPQIWDPDFILFLFSAALFESSLRGNLDSVKELLSNGADVNATDDSNGKTPLLLAGK